MVKCYFVEMCNTIIEEQQYRKRLEDSVSMSRRRFLYIGFLEGVEVMKSDLQTLTISERTWNFGRKH